MNKFHYEEANLNNRVLTSQEANQKRLRPRDQVTETAVAGAGGDAQHGNTVVRELTQYDDITVQDFPNFDHTCVLADLNVDSFEEKSKQIQRHLEHTDFSQDIIVLPNMFFSQSISATRFIDFTNVPLVGSNRKFEYIKMVNRRKIVEKLKALLDKKHRCMLYGPQGCGKSFVLMQLVALLIQEGHFVVYINNATYLLSDIVNILAAKVGTNYHNLSKIDEIKKSVMDPTFSIEKREDVALSFLNEAIILIKVS